MRRHVMRAPSGAVRRQFHGQQPGNSRPEEFEQMRRQRHKDEAEAANRRITEEIHRLRQKAQRQGFRGFEDDFNEADRMHAGGGGGKDARSAWEISGKQDQWLQKWGFKSEAVPFEVLGLESGAPFDEVKAAYRSLVKSCHPDAGGDAVRFKEVTNAYTALRQRAKDIEALGGDSQGGSKEEEEDDPFKYEYDPVKQEKYARMRNPERVREHYRKQEAEAMTQELLTIQKRTEFMMSVFFTALLLGGWILIYNMMYPTWRGQRRRGSHLEEPEQKGWFS